MNQYYYYYYHWIAIYVDENGHYGEYFDSLGRVPTHTFERNMNTVANRFITVNNYRVLLVDFVDTGHYCACFCFFSVEVSICVAFSDILLAILDLMMQSCMN